MHILFFCEALKAEILKHPGIKFNPNGYTIDKQKLIKVCLIKIICVLTLRIIYTIFFNNNINSTKASYKIPEEQQKQIT